MTDKKFDKLMKDAKDVLDMMPEAHNFSRRTVYNPSALSTSWFIEDSELADLKAKPENVLWLGPNPVEKFVMDCEHTINALMEALKEMANDYDSLEQLFNEYKNRQPSETAKQLFDHVNGRGIQLIDILVDLDKAHLKVENRKFPETTFTTLEEAYPHAHRTLDDWNGWCTESAADGLNYFLNEYDNYMNHLVCKDDSGVVIMRFNGPKEAAKYPSIEYHLTSLADWLKHASELEHIHDFSEDFEFLNKISWDIGTMGQESFTEKTGERIREIVEKLKDAIGVEEE